MKNSLFCGKSQADNAFSADSRGLFAAAGEWNRPTTITCWNVANAVQVVEFKHTGEVLSITVSSDGKGLAAGGADKTVSIWKITPTPEQ